MGTTTQHPVSRALETAGRRKDWLARELGIHPTMLSHYLAERRVPPMTFYVRTAELLGVPVEDITPEGTEVAA